MIRAFEERDAPAVDRLLRERDPYHMTTKARVLHEARSQPPRAHFTSFVAEEDGEVAGWGSAGLLWQVAADAVGYAHAVVREACEGRGIGRALADRAEGHLRELGVEMVRAFAYEGSRGNRFAADRGFEVARRERVVELDPRAAVLPRADVPLVSLRDIQDREYDLFELFLTVESAFPSDFSWTGYSFEEWKAWTWEDPTLDDETSVVALVDGRVVSASWLLVDDTGEYAEVEVTGTLPAFRRRGLARACKSESLRRAAARGIGRVSAENDFENEGMIAINSALGFRPVAVNLELAKVLRPG